MFWDEDYINDEFDRLKEMIENGTFEENRCSNFISYDELEDEYSHTEIGYAQEMFIQKAKEYLSKYPKQYAIWCDWCVHISTTKLYREIMWKNSNHKKEYIELRESRDII